MPEASSSGVTVPPFTLQVTDETAAATALDLEKLFEREAIVPMPLATEKLPVDILRAYMAWADLLGAWPDQSEEPWVPVGAVGPIMILGHYRPREQPVLLPRWVSGRAQITEAIYRRFQAELVEAKERESNGHKAAYERPPKARLPNVPPNFKDDRDALSFLVAHFILEPAVRGAARGALDRGTPPGELSNGLREAVMFLRMRCALVDTRFLNVTQTLLELAPNTTKRFMGFAYQRTTEAYFVAFDHVPPSAHCEEFVSHFRAEVEDRDRSPVHFALTTSDHLKHVLQLNRATQATREVKRPIASSGGGAKPDLKLTLDEVKRIDPDRQTTTDEELARWALGQAIAMDSQDLHLMFIDGEGVFRVNKDGVLETLKTFAENRWASVCGALRTLAKIDGSFSDCVSKHFSVSFDGVMVDFRVEATPFRDCSRPQNLTLRVMKKDSRIRTLDDLQLRADYLTTTRKIIAHTEGLFLITGPTGSGKTTTIYAALNELNIPDVKIMTAEDPIERVIEGVHQAQIIPERDLTFAKLLRSFLRAAPKVIMVGEIRDRETMEVSMQAANTGHFVISTIHVNNAASVPARLVDLGVLPGYAADTLVAASAQRLVRVLCPTCKVSTETTEEQREVFARIGVETPSMLFTHGQDARCPHCRGRGYDGVTAVMEIMVTNDALRDAIKKGASVKELTTIAAYNGFRPLAHEALCRVADGVTSFEEAQKKVLLSIR